MNPRSDWKPGEFVYHRFGYAARILDRVEVPGYETAGPWYKVKVLTGKLKGDTRTVTWRDLAPWSGPYAEGKAWSNPAGGQVRRARRWLRRLRGRAYRYAYALQSGKNPPGKIAPDLAAAIAAALEVARGPGAGGAVAVFIGHQPRVRGPALELWNLLIDLPGHPRGSTLARETIEAAGHQLPPATGSPACTCPDLPMGGYAGSFGHYAGPGEPCPLAKKNPRRRGRSRRNPPADWLVPSEIGDEGEQEPTEGDYTITGTRRGGEGVAEVGGKFLGEFRDVDAALAFIVKRMEAKKFFPNVWTVSDHGNTRLVGMDEFPRPGPPGRRNPPTTATTEGQILDFLAEAVHRHLGGDATGWAWVWHRSMSARDRLAFDLFLVRTHDPLAHEAGTAEGRFRTRVLRMAELERHRKAGTVPRNPCHRPTKRPRSKGNQNPPRGRGGVPKNAIKIYDSYAFDAGTVGRGRHVGGGRYYHRHSSKTRMQTFGLPDGSLVLKPHRGKLWGYR